MLTSRNFDFSTDYSVTSPYSNPTAILLGTIKLNKWPGRLVYQMYDNIIADGTSSAALMRLFIVTPDGLRVNFQSNTALALENYKSFGEYYESGLAGRIASINNIAAGCDIELYYRPPTDIGADFSSRINIWGCISKVGMT